MSVAPSGQMSQLMESALLKPLRHSPPSGGQFAQNEHDIMPVDSDVRPLGKFFGYIMQAPLNIPSVSVSADISKFERSWLNEVAE